MIQSLLNKPFLIFFIAVLIIAIPLFIFPINLFDGVIIMKNGLPDMKNGLPERKIEVPLSLSYFIGFGFNSIDMEGIKDFYLLPKGYLLAFCIILGCPAIVTYRIFLAQKKKKKGK